MRLVLAILIPWLQFFTIGRYWAGVICLLLQITLIGWLPAAIWSVYALVNYETDKKIEKLTAEKDGPETFSNYARKAPASSDQDGGGDE
ncbi:YqaE/Pmp3 family membrane protein [Vibrio sp. V1B]|uniref:YqaE/Pmp3 family membrane protein n=1 Tax=Vibrio harveyi group TaxID=717610 RepID=UPI0003A5E730|nr:MULTISPECIES: YqaE/Pmp3 family membrane protein [Vibrio harveyi group]PAW12206.1 YqaE/Pmp3 family membrane protein [Vibrio sp. V1B]